MKRLESVIAVDRPRDDVFRMVVDDFAQTQPLICSLALSVELENSGPIAAGVKGHIVVSRLGLTKTTLAFEATDYVKNVRFSIVARHRNREARTEYFFSDVDGGTEIKTITSFDDPGPPFLQPLTLRTMLRHERRDNRRLKDLLEGRRSGHVRAVRVSWRALMIYVLVASVLAVIVATYRTLTS